MRIQQTTTLGLLNTPAFPIWRAWFLSVLLASGTFGLGLPAVHAQTPTPIPIGNQALLAGWDFDNILTTSLPTSPVRGRYSDVWGNNQSPTALSAPGGIYFNGQFGSDSWGTVAKNTTGDINRDILTRTGTGSTFDLGGQTGGEGAAWFNNASVGTVAMDEFSINLHMKDAANSFQNLRLSLWGRDSGNLGGATINWFYSIDGGVTKVATGLSSVFSTNVFSESLVDFSAITALNNQPDIYLIGQVVEAASGVTLNLDNIGAYAVAAGTGTPPSITSALAASGTVGTPFSYTITATNTPTSFTATPLPAGLTVNTTTGLISGTPTTAGVTNTTITATNGSGSDTETLVITISEATSAPNFTTHPANTTIAAGANASFTVAATGNPTPTFTWQYNSGGGWTALGSTLGSATVSGQATASVTLTGVPASLTGYQFRALASNSVQADVASNAATLTVNTPATIPSVGQPVARTITAGASTTFTVAPEGTTPFSYKWESKPSGSDTWTIITGPTLGGATVTGATAATLELASVPEALNGTSFRALVTNPAATDVASDAALLTVSAIVLNPPVITSAGSANGTVGQPFSYQIVATNSPTSYGATGLPAGLSVNTTTGLISGTPSAAGTTNATISATNADGTGSQALVITIAAAPVPAITSALTAGGSVGQAFSYQITASNSPTSFAATGLPAGLTVNTTTGAITGTPTTAGATNVTLSAANANGTGPESTLVITIAAGPTPVINSPLTASGTVGTAFSYQITATESPTSFSATGLPAGLAVNTTTGAITGTPTQVGTSNVTLNATNANGTGANSSLVITIAPPSAPVVTNPQIASGRVGEAFSYQIAATYAESYGSGTLPAGLTLNTTTGVISGTPTVATDVAVAISATNSVGTSNATLLLTILPQAPVIADLPAEIVIQVNEPYTLDVDATNSPTSITADTLPAGLSINTTTGVVSGTPTTVGDTTTTFTATNDGGQDTESVVFRVVSYPTAETFFKLEQTGGMNACVFVRPDRTGIFLAYHTGTDDVITERDVVFAQDWTFSFIVADTAGTSSPITVSGSVTGVAATFTMTGASGNWTASRASGSGTGSIQTLFMLGEVTGTVYTAIFPDSSVQTYLDAGSVQDFGTAASSTGGATSVTTLENYVVATQTGAGGTVTGTITVPGAGATIASVRPAALPAGVIQLAGLGAGVEPARNLINLSGRSYVNTAANPAICGFVVEGTQPAKVLIRSAGPALTRFNVSGVLADPRLTVYDRNQNAIGSNDNWSAGSQTEVDEIRAVTATVSAFTFADGSLDSAIVMTLNPGLYTAVATGLGQTDTGITIVEVYDSNPAADPARVNQLVNSSVRAWVNTGEGVTNGGFIVRGNAPKKVLIRAVGPTLAGFTVANPLADPVLTVFNRGTGAKIAENDDWSASATKADIIAAARAVSAFGLPDPSADSVVLITLMPGEYTAIVEGKSGGVGNALLEIYEVED